MKKHWWKIEYSITLLVLLSFIMLLIPLKLENYRQARFISQWKEQNTKLVYLFSVINAQKSEEIIKSLNNSETPQQREAILLQLIKPYMRIHNVKKIPWRYRPKCMNGSRISKKDDFYFNELYFSETQKIIGVKDITAEKDNDAWFMLMFDVNGFLPPNTWGKDIFGVYIYDEGRTVPFGYTSSIEDLQKDCSKTGKGFYCSYYYLIGGEFND